MARSHEAKGGGSMWLDLLTGSIKEKLDEALGDLGRFNLLVVGNTGAGKTIFGFKIAQARTDRPVTQGTSE